MYGFKISTKLKFRNIFDNFMLVYGQFGNFCYLYHKIILESKFSSVSGLAFWNYFKNGLHTKMVL